MSTVLDEILSGEADHESTLVQHPRLGYGRIVGEPGEMEAMETDELGYEFEGGGGGGAGMIKHPRLGLGRVVPRGGTGSHELEDHEAEVIGADTRNLVTATTAVPYRWVCCLDLYFPDPDNSSKELFFRGSGTLVSPKHVLTCGHCVFDDVEGSRGTWKKLQVRRIVVRPGRAGPTTAPFGSANSIAVNYNSAWRTSQSSQSDFGLVTLNKALGSTKFASLGNKALGWWGDPTNGAGTKVIPTIEPPSRMQGSLINLSGYPGDKCNTQPANGSATRAQLKACPEASWASAQWHATGNCTTPAVAGQPRLMRYTNDTFGGHSGSPVWLRWQTTRWLIAIHHAGSGTGSYNEGVRVTPELWNQVRAWM